MHRHRVWPWVVGALFVFLMFSNQPPEETAQTGQNAGQLISKIADGAGNFLSGLAESLNRNTTPTPAP